MPSDTLDFLLGTWRLDRSVSDHRSGQQGSFSGLAEIIPGQAPLPGGAAGPARYSEHGELRYGTHRGPASRELQFVDLGDGTVAVRFADGRAFYHLDLRSGHCTAVHACGPDSYRLTCQVRGDGLIREHWHALGPAKDYEIRTSLTRV